MSTATRSRTLILKPHEQAALRDGRLGMVIRPVKPQPFQSEHEDGKWLIASGRSSWHTNKRLIEVRDRKTGVLISSEERTIPPEKWLLEYSPFGSVGDELWIKETYCLVSPNGEPLPPGGKLVERPVDGEPTEVWYGFDVSIGLAHTLGDDGLRWKSPATMPRWASRDTLRLTSLAVKRIQDATEEEMIAWGSPSEMVDSGGSTPWGEWIETPDYTNGFVGLAVELFGPEAWDENHWCVFGGVERNKGDV